MSSNPSFRDERERSTVSRYQALSDSASDSIAVYCCDATGVITYYSSSAAELWGRKPAIGDTDQRFCGSHMLYRVDGSYMPHDQCPMAEVLAGKVTGVFDAEVQIERPDGSRIIAIVNIAPLIDENGVIVGAVNSFYEDPKRRAVNVAREKLLPVAASPTGTCSGVADASGTGGAGGRTFLVDPVHIPLKKSRVTPAHLRRSPAISCELFKAARARPPLACRLSVC